MPKPNWIKDSSGQPVLSVRVAHTLTLPELIAALAWTERHSMDEQLPALPQFEIQRRVAETLRAVGSDRLHHWIDGVTDGRVQVIERWAREAVERTYGYATA